eukprot:COSAG01_NODE_25860_length_731_cov_0.846519_2_plen_45_part_01
MHATAAGVSGICHCGIIGYAEAGDQSVVSTLVEQWRCRDRSGAFN